MAPRFWDQELCFYATYSWCIDLFKHSGSLMFMKLVSLCILQKRHSILCFSVVSHGFIIFINFLKPYRVQGNCVNTFRTGWKFFIQPVQQWWATFGSEGQDKGGKRIFVGYIISKTYILQLCVVDDNPVIICASTGPVKLTSKLILKNLN